MHMHKIQIYSYIDKYVYTLKITLQMMVSEKLNNHVLTNPHNVTNIF